MNDCISLYEVIIKFNKFIYDKFKINVLNYPTLPSLTFAIFRSNYLRKIEKLGYYVPLINGNMYNDLKNSYTGGATDMYIPENPKGTKVYANDVNSLYPTTMVDMKMPIISRKKKYVTYFEVASQEVLDKLDYLKSDLGFFNTEIETTIDLEHPILQVKYDTGNGVRTISPLGK